MEHYTAMTMNILLIHATNMVASQNRIMRKRIHILLLHLYKSQKHTKVTYGGRMHDSG